MSHRTTLNNDLIMSRIDERQPNQRQVQIASSTSPESPTTRTRTGPIDRLGTPPLSMSNLADTTAFSRQATCKRLRSPTHALSKSD
jgi:hypothetical protein